MVALEVMSFACPFLVAGAWAAMRRRGRPALMGPALYAAVVGTGGLMIPAAERQLPLPVCALGIAFALAFAGLIDFIRPDQGHGPEDHNDDGGGGGWPPPPPRGCAPRDPEWWPDFEREFWAHVSVGAARRDGETVGFRRAGGSRRTPTARRPF
jgi:hypothetical protein